MPDEPYELSPEPTDDWPETAAAVIRFRTAHSNEGFIAIQFDCHLPGMPDTRHRITVAMPKTIALAIGCELGGEVMAHLAYEGGDAEPLWDDNAMWVSYR